MIEHDIRLKEIFLQLLPAAEPVAKGKEPVASVEPEKRSERGIDAFWPVVANDLRYHSEDGTEYIKRAGKLFLLDSRNRELMEDLRLAGRDLTGKVPSRETITTAIDLLCAMARRDGEEVELFNRCGARDGKFYYDLGNGKAVEMEPLKWRVVDVPVMFKRMRHQKEQCAPALIGDIRRVLEFCQLPVNQQLLFLVTLVTCFVPRIAHPVIHASGSQGSGKSVFTSLWKSLIDPSSVVLSTMPRKPEDLDLLLVRHYGLVLDNLSALNADTCDRLCSFITGGVIEKRTLHTDLETTILKANSIVFFSSIGSLHSRPDMTERTIVFELERVPAEKRMEEEELFESFRAAIPEILGGVFNLLSRAMEIYPDIKLEGLPRMASFAKWGYAIAEAMGGRGVDFLDEYANNSTIQTGSLLERDTFLSAIVQAMDDPELFPLRGSFHEVLEVLAKVAVPDGEKNNFKALDKDYTFPKARGFRKHLERIRIPLDELGITFELNDQRTSRGKAFVTFYKKTALAGDEVPF